jgi:putative nucleotidyltransferase with HDIG domain
MRSGLRLYSVLRILVFIAGCLLITAAVAYIGFPASHALVIAAVTGLLCLFILELPWGGFLAPSDGILLALCLLAGSIRIAPVGIAIAIAAGAFRKRPGRAILAGALRNVVALFAALGLWRALVPTWMILLNESQAVLISRDSHLLDSWIFSAAALPALLLCSLGYLVMSSFVDSLLRPRREYDFGEYWLLNYGRNLHHHFFTVVLGAIACIVHRATGPVAFVVFAFPVLLTRDAFKRGLDLRASRIDAVKALSSSVDARDKYTHDHSNRVSRLACRLAREMGFPETTVEKIEGGALLHDIGKISVDTEVLSKPGPLDDDEMEMIRQHPLNSADIISRLRLLRESAEIVVQHHERPDGRGYPEGLRGHEISVGARILNVADAFDAMTTDRPYRKKRSLDEAIDELSNGSGSEFDPVVVEYLMRMIEDKKVACGRISEGRVSRC